MKDEARVQEAKMANQLRADFEEQGFKPNYFIGKQVEVSVEIWNKDRRKHDLDNQLASIMDALIKAGVLPDDSQETVAKESVEYKGVHKEDPRAEITIKERGKNV